MGAIVRVGSVVVGTAFSVGAGIKDIHSIVHSSEYDTAKKVVLVAIDTLVISVKAGCGIACLASKNKEEVGFLSRVLSLEVDVIRKAFSVVFEKNGFRDRLASVADIADMIFTGFLSEQKFGLLFVGWWKFEKLKLGR